MYAPPDTHRALRRRLNNFLLDAWVSKWRGMCGVDGLRALVLGKMRSPIPTAMPFPGEYLPGALDSSLTSTTSRAASRGRRQSMGTLHTPSVTGLCLRGVCVWVCARCAYVHMWPAIFRGLRPSVWVCLF
jgi:hypothetical protein